MLSPPSPAARKGPRERLSTLAKVRQYMIKLSNKHPGIIHFPAMNITFARLD
jgi:hypothetical protein